jgi:hypothetical protein
MASTFMQTHVGVMVYQGIVQQGGIRAYAYAYAGFE